ncbi:MAG: hypothetical protein M1825_000569 [Sarcosagium campestre]|nr:MAG: hypothetical protein M1825_000569 [Sarcosagium campestre]
MDDQQSQQEGTTLYSTCHLAQEQAAGPAQSSNMTPGASKETCAPMSGTSPARAEPLQVHHSSFLPIATGANAEPRPSRPQDQWWSFAKKSWKEQVEMMGTDGAMMVPPLPQPRRRDETARVGRRDNRGARGSGRGAPSEKRGNGRRGGVARNAPYPLDPQMNVQRARGGRAMANSRGRGAAHNASQHNTHAHSSLHQGKVTIRRGTVTVVPRGHGSAHNTYNHQTNPQPNLNRGKAFSQSGAVVATHRGNGAIHNAQQHQNHAQSSKSRGNASARRANVVATPRGLVVNIPSRYCTKATQTSISPNMLQEGEPISSHPDCGHTVAPLRDNLPDQHHETLSGGDVDMQDVDCHPGSGVSVTSQDFKSEDFRSSEESKGRVHQEIIPNGLYQSKYANVPPQIKKSQSVLVKSETNSLSLSRSADSQKSDSQKPDMNDRHEAMPGLVFQSIENDTLQAESMDSQGKTGQSEGAQTRVELLQAEPMKRRRKKSLKKQERDRTRIRRMSRSAKREGQLLRRIEALERVITLPEFPIRKAGNPEVVVKLPPAGEICQN